MNAQTRTGVLIAALMSGATALAVVMRPSHKIADAGPKIDLETHDSTTLRRMATSIKGINKGLAN